MFDLRDSIIEEDPIMLIDDSSNGGIGAHVPYETGIQIIDVGGL